MKTVHDNTSPAPADKRAKMKELHESSTEKINAVLTPDQPAKWKMKQEMMEKHKEMKSQGQMDQPKLTTFARTGPDTWRRPAGVAF
jgi:hypothetical protein